MAYCALADIKEQLSNDDIVALTDDEGLGVIDEGAVDRAIADADAIIDSYAGHRYTTPFTTVPARVRQVSVDIAIYHLMSRRWPEVIETRKARYKEAMAWLKDVADGRAFIAGTTPANSGQKAETEYGDRLFTRTTLKGLL